MADWKRSLAVFGYIAPLVSVGCITLGTILDPKFTWRSRSLSSIGEATSTSLLTPTLDQVAFTLFNGGLVLAALLGAPFVIALWLDARRHAERAGVGLLAVTLAGNAGVGVAYLDGPFDPLHFLTAMVSFFGVALTIWVHTSGVIHRISTTDGVRLFWVANAYVLVWVFWIALELVAFQSDDVLTWFAVPEYAAGVALGIWTISQARRIRRDESAGGVSSGPDT